MATQSLGKHWYPLCTGDHIIAAWLVELVSKAKLRKPVNCRRWIARLDKVGWSLRGRARAA